MAPSGDHEVQIALLVNLEFFPRREYLISKGHKIKNMEEQAKRAVTAIDLVDNDDEVPLRITIQKNLSTGDFALKPQDVTNEESEEIVVNETVQDIDHPYIGRQVGVTAPGLVRRLEAAENQLKNKKCPACGKKFVNGKTRKSKCLACISCNRLTHEKYGSKKTPFKCKICDIPTKELNTSDVNENHIEEVAIETDNIQDILCDDLNEDAFDHIPVIIAGHETSEPFPIHEEPSTEYYSGTLPVAGDTNLFPELEEPPNKTGSDVFAVLDSVPDVTNVVG